MFKTVHFAVCDKCDKEGPAACNGDWDEGFAQAVEAAREEFWFIDEENDECTCPDCNRKEVLG